MKRNPAFYPSILCACFALVSVLFLASCSKQEAASTQPVVNTPADKPLDSPIPKSLGTIAYPADNPMNDPAIAARIELGRHFFYDRALSVDQSTSCASCHNPTMGFSDP